MGRVVAVSAVLMALGCASGPESLELERLHSVREARFSEPGGWETVEGAVTNVIPPDATPDDLKAARDGAGVSLALVDELDAQDVWVEAQVAFGEGGAPGIAFRVREDDGVVSAMYVLVVFGRGIVLWRLKDGHAEPLYTNAFFVAADTPHVIGVRAVGDLIAIGFNGREIYTVKDTLLVEPGGVGISAREGPCYFLAFHSRSLD